MTKPRLLALLLTCALAPLLAPASGRAATSPIVDLSSDPWYIGWSALLPPGYLGVDTDSSDACVAGQSSCVAKVARYLSGQVDDLGCNHNAVFSLTYLRVTQKVYDTVTDDPAFFDDWRWLDHYDSTFAQAYLRAWNGWQTGGSVPEAWQIAFRDADAERVSAAGNLLLGINAHVNGDLPFILYSIGLVAPDGSSRKPDHDRVNELLNAVLKPVIDEIAARYDPTVEIAPGGGSLADLLEFQLLPAWREAAWRNAVALASAPDAATRSTIAASIQASAAQEATLLESMTRYVPPLSGPEARDAFCAAANG